MATTAAPQAPITRGLRAHRSAPVLVATDGREQSDGALRVGLWLAGGADAMQVLTVLAPMPIVPSEIPVPVPDDVIDGQRAELRRSCEVQMRRVLSREHGVTLDVREGDPAATIARKAREANALMIVCGIGRHTVSNRLFGTETALRLIRFSTVPVLAVGSSLVEAPTRIVVGVDFTETSVRAAKHALEIAPRPATIYLVHVGPRVHSGTPNGWGSAYKEDAGAGLRRIEEQMRTPRGTTVQHVLLQGDPATELLSFASSVEADLIATGSHGRGFVARLLVGSVATKLIRNSTYPVLVVPHLAAMDKLHASTTAPVMTNYEKAEWTNLLDSFTSRNAGRRTTIEVDDPETGAHSEEHGFPLIATSYDTQRDHVSVILGDKRPRGRQHSRTIGDPAPMSLLSESSGRDIALRIPHGLGQTLLSFSD